MTVILGIPPMVIDPYTVDLLGLPNGHRQLAGAIGRGGQDLHGLARCYLTFTEAGHGDDRAAVKGGREIGGGEVKGIFNVLLFQDET